MDKTEDEKYIARCIQLARSGRCTVSPNPMVGAVIVCDGKIIGEGFHIRSGEGHAEVNAVRSVKDLSLLTHSTLYVSMEPCSHYGKTPPCADMIIAEHIPRVVIGCQDPSAKVDGKGIKKLQEAGIDVTVGVLEDECKQLIAGFYTPSLLYRPYITLKWAESADGFIDAEGKHTTISSPHTMMLVHKKRAENDAIMVGTETALKDNPQLTTREWYGKNPIRVVLDRTLRLPQTLHLFDGSVHTLVITTKKHRSEEKLEFITLPEDFFDLTHILKELTKRNIQTLLIEGGSRLQQSFIDSDLWDEAFIEQSNVVLSQGVAAAHLKNIKKCEKGCFFSSTILHYYHF